MKTTFKLLFAAFMTLAMFAPAQAGELTIYEGAESKTNAPFNGRYVDSEGVLTQVIYPESALTELAGTNINSITFYLLDDGGNPLSAGTYEVSIGMTSQTTFGSYAPQAITGLTHVANVTLNQGDTEIFIEFEEPFMYDGGNLVIETKTVAAYYDYADLHFAGVWETGTYNVLTKLLYSSSSSSFYPKATFGYGNNEWGARVTPRELAFGEVYPDQDATLTLTIKNIGANAFTPVFGDLEAPFSISPAASQIASGAMAEYTVTFAPTALGEYSQLLTIDCGDAGVFEVPLSGAQVEEPCEITVNEGTATFSTLPIYGLYYDVAGTQCQMIYPEDMMADLAGKKLTSVRFYPTQPLAIENGNIQVSLRVVEQNAFTEAVAITDMAVVANVIPVKGSTELEFVFDEPFEYNGGNLAIETLVTEGGSYNSTYFYGNNLSYRPSMYHYVTNYGAYNQVNTFLPTATFSYLKEDTPEPQSLRGDVNMDQGVSISDVTALIDYLLTQDASAIDLEAANCNLDEGISISDVTALIDYLLTGVWND